MILSPGINGTASFCVYSRPQGVEQFAQSWTLHVTSQVSPAPDTIPVAEVKPEGIEEIQARCVEQVSGHDYYQSLRESGVHYGPFFQSLTQLWRYNGEVLGEVLAPDGLNTVLPASQVHPAILDACIQMLGATASAHETSNGHGEVYMPTHVDQVRVFARAGLPIWSHAHLRKREADAIEGDVQLRDEAGRAVVEILGLRFARVGHEAPAENVESWLYELQWQSRERQEVQKVAELPRSASQGRWLIFTDSSGMGEALAAQVESRGERSILISQGNAYEHRDETHFRIHPERPEDFRQFFAAA